MTDNRDDDKRGDDRRPRSGPRDGAPRSGKKPFDKRASGDKPFRKREEGGDGRPFRAREDRPYGDRPPRRDGDRPFRPREDGERTPFRKREEGGEGRPFRAREDRPYGDRPPRRDGDRPFRPREDGERKPFRKREEGGEGRPFRAREDRPYGDRPPPRDGDRPFRARDDGERKPFRKREDVDRRPTREEEAEDNTNRIAKVIARAGLCSRRDAEAWIVDGRVSVNGTVIDSPALDVADTDVILVDGAPLPQRERTRLWLYHKPKGLETTEHSPEGRPTVFDNLPPGLPRVMSVGRLDINTEGLLLLTNDGGLARVLAHPKTAWLRRYRVRVHGEVNQAQLDTLREGITIEDPEEGPITYAPIVAKFERSRGDNAWLTMDLREGKNREIKRVLEHFGLQVTRLIRISFGPFQLGDMPEGTAEEIRGRHLRDQLGERLAEEAGADFDSPVFTHLEQVLAPEKPKGFRSPPQDREGRARFAATEEELPKRRYDPKKPGEKRDAAILGKRDDLKVSHEKVADRKGREVKVDRIASLERSADDNPLDRYSRAELADPNRSFRPGREPRRERPSFGDRPPRDGERKPFRPREDGDRPFKPRGDRPFRERDGEDRGKPRGERPFRAREDGERKPFRAREDGDRPFKPRGDRPFRERDGEDRGKPRGERPFRAREDGERKPFRPREDGDRPFKPRGDRPSFGDRPPRDGDRPFKPRFGGKPGGKPGGFGGRPGGGPRGPRPSGGGGKFSGGRGADRRR